MAKVKTGSSDEGRAVIHVAEGKAKIYKRPDSSVWQMKVRIRAGKWLRASTGTEDQEELKRLRYRRPMRLPRENVWDR